MANEHTTSIIEANKALIQNFYAKVGNARQTSALKDFVSEDYVEHNAELDNGRAALETFFGQIFGGVPEISFRLIRIIAEGDLVFAHVLLRRNQEDRGTAVADIFRIVNGKIVEHWDVMAPIPGETKNNIPVM